MHLLPPPLLLSSSLKKALQANGKCNINLNYNLK